MESRAERGASFRTSERLQAENGPLPRNSGPICVLRQHKSCCFKSHAPSTSAFADIKRMIDEPEWEAFHQDLSSSDFERIRVTTQEPEAFCGEENDILTCGSGNKNVGKRKRRENSLRDHPGSSSRRHKSRRLETEQSPETCEREKDRDSEIPALTPIALNVNNCFVKIEPQPLNSNSNAVCSANSDSDVSEQIKQELECSSVQLSAVPTLHSENESFLPFNENCDRGIESVQDSVGISASASIQTTAFRHGKSGENSAANDSDSLSTTKEFELEAWHRPIVSYSVSSSDFEQMDRESENLALTPNRLNIRNCIVKTERLALESNSNAVCLANSDVSKRIKQEPECGNLLQTSVPTLDSENESSIALNEDCAQRIMESVQDSVVFIPISSIVSEKHSLIKESEPLVECPDQDDHALVSLLNHNCIVQIPVPASKQSESCITQDIVVADTAYSSHSKDNVIVESNLQSTNSSVLGSMSVHNSVLTDTHNVRDSIPVSRQSDSCILKDVTPTDNANSLLSKDALLEVNSPSANNSVLGPGLQQPVVEDAVPSSKQAESSILEDLALADSTRCSVLNDPATLIPAVNTESVELTTGTKVSQCSVSASSSGQEENVVNSAADVPVSISDCGKNLNRLESDKSKDVRRSSRSKPEKVSYMEHSDDEEFYWKVSSEDVDSSDDDFNPDEQLSDDEVENDKVENGLVDNDNVEITKSMPLSVPDKNVKTDNELLTIVIDTLKTTAIFKPFSGTELETLAPEVVNYWRSKGLSIKLRGKSVISKISKYIRKTPKYLEMLTTYVYDGTDEDTIRSLPSMFYCKRRQFHFRVKCPICCKILTVRLFQDHMNNHANNRPHRCKKCGRGYLSEYALITHEKESKCSGTPFECKVCGKPYEGKTGVRRHEKSHEPNRKKHKCHLCDAVFILPKSLKDHVARHTNPEYPRMFQCHVCGKQFLTKAFMNRHHSTIHLKKVQPNEIKKCHAKFETKYQYEKHVLLHKGTEKPFKCPNCNKGFATHQVLKHHIMTHTGEKPHKCDICGHAFTQIVALNKHRFTHQGRKPYRCDKCGKDSQRKQDIIEHKCSVDKSVTKEGDNDPVPLPVLTKAKKLSSTNKKKKVLRSKSILSNESDKSIDVRRSSRSKVAKVSYKEHSEDDESWVKVSLEDGDSLYEDFKPDEQLLDDEVEDDQVEGDQFADNQFADNQFADNQVEGDQFEIDQVEIAKSTPLTVPSAPES